GYSNGVGTSSEAFRWTATSGMVGLGNLPSQNASRALATNADGSVVVGDSGTTCCYVANQQAFRWTAASGMAGLGFLPGGNMSIAHGVSGGCSNCVWTRRN